MYVGVGAARVRNLFAQAASKAPCLIFIDELDAIGKSRSAGGGAGSAEERDQTLNQLLVAMDGFDSGLGVIVMAATNRPETLDPALVRPGRFDRNVSVDRPDIAGREQILKVHTRKVALEDQINLRHIAAMTPGFVGADLANLVNEAALLAARKGKRQVGRIEFEEGVERVVAGPEKRPATRSSPGAFRTPTRSTRSRSSVEATAPSVTPCIGPRMIVFSTPRVGSKTPSGDCSAGPSPRS
jgi:cell division protease FtsH